MVKVAVVVEAPMDQDPMVQVILITLSIMVKVLMMDLLHMVRMVVMVALTLEEVEEELLTMVVNLMCSLVMVVLVS